MIRLLLRVRHWMARRSFDRDLAEELETHRSLRRAHLEQSGLSEADAEAASVRALGNRTLAAEEAREVWAWSRLGDLARDLRFAVRGLRRTPAFTLVAVASLAIGLALTTSMVSVINAYLIRSLPYPEAKRLYHVSYAPPGPWEPAGMSALDWTSLRDVVEFPIAAAGESFYLADGGRTVSLRALRVTHGFADGLPVSVTIGRRFDGGEFARGSEPVALIGHSLWRDRFGSDPGVMGRVIRAEPESGRGRAETFRIVGVLTPGFYFGSDSRAGLDLIVPQTAPTRTYMVRLRAGVPPAAAERRLTEAARRAASAPLPADWSGVRLESAHERWVGSLRPILLAVTAAVSLVILIVCANVAVLLLLRSMQRQKEVAVRLALGSGWGHIARMLLAEITILCAAGAGAGVAITALLLRTLAPLIETQLGRPAPSAAGITMDTTVLLLVAGISLLLVVALSLAPLTSWGQGLTNALQQDGRVASDGRSMRRLRGGLIVLEIAGSLVLFVGCGLMVQSVVKMMGTDRGFRAEGLAASRIMLRARNYPDPAAYRLFHERFARRLSDQTGSLVAFSSWPPNVPPPVHLIEPDTGGPASAGAIAVSAGYFATFGIQLRQGREFTAEEASTEAPVTVLSETLARRLWPDGTAIGRRVREVEPTPAGATTGPWRTVLGVAGDVRQTYQDADQADFYKPRTPDGRFGSFYVRTGRAAPPLSDELGSVAAGLDRDAVINPPRLVVDADQSLTGTRFLTVMLTGFAAVAGFLAMLGIYGVTAYAVQQRQKEIAIRVALGASARAVVRIFLREGALLLGAGTVLGLIGGAAVSRVLRSHVFGVQSYDPATYLAASAVLLLAGFTTVFWAARRAAATDPVSALNAG